MLWPLICWAQEPATPDPIPTIRALFEEHKWNEVVQAVEASPDRSRMLYYYGVALAQLGRLDDAQGSLLQGRALSPRDARFPVELGGIAFKKNNYPEAARWLRIGLRLSPADAYANNFLATVYFLQGNLEAALKYWNRIDKPRIEDVTLPPTLRVDPVLLDRAFTFSPAATLTLRDFLATERRVEGLGIFPMHRIRLQARSDGNFDAVFDAVDNNGWGSSKWEALLSTFRGVFYETLYPEYANLRRSAVNVSALARWDEQKRRLNAAYSAPRSKNPKYRYEVGFDLRNENWDLRQAFKTPQAWSGALNLRRDAINGRLISFGEGRMGWSAGAELSRRAYRTTVGPIALSDLLADGYQLKQLAQFDFDLKRIPEARFATHLTVSSELAAIWSAPKTSFGKLQAAVATTWYPRMRGEDYAMQAQVRAGTTMGTAPFDELFMLGAERDNALWMRAHLGTHDGQKGSAPLGRSYVLLSSEVDKNVYSNGLLTVKLAPFLDTGRAYGSGYLGPQQWLWDTGVQLKLRVFGVGAAFIYGRDLRAGRNTFFSATNR
jgi:tetratricopeptide (TPR) repeat protein